MSTPLTSPDPARRPYDEAMMAQACAEAERGRGRTSPNPTVGAVIVDERDGLPRVVATGYHARLGADHAEVAALRHLGGKAPGMTVYVTLEPCNHQGRTGKCTDALIAAGVARVVVGTRDPNPSVAGGGAERLRAAGIQVEVGVHEAACRDGLRQWLGWVRTGRPHLLCKAALSLDGRIAPAAAATGRPVWLTGAHSRLIAHRLRDGSDAILVGAGTVLADDPLLTVRLPADEARDDRQPLRVVLDGALRAPPTARVFGEGTLLYTSGPAAAAQADKLAALRDRGVEVVILPPTGAAPAGASPTGAAPAGAAPTAVSPTGASPTDVDLPALLADLGRRGVVSVLCEGGATLHGALLAARLYDEAALFFAPIFLGDAGVPLGRGLAVAGPELAPRLRDVQVQGLGGDVLLRGRFADPDAPPHDPTQEPSHVHRPG